MKWLIKIWRYFFPLKETTTPIETIAVDPRFKHEDGDGDNWKNFKRVNCPKCGSPAQILGDGKINDKVRCARKCGMRGYFDGVYVRWNGKFMDRR